MNWRLKAQTATVEATEDPAFAVHFSFVAATIAERPIAANSLSGPSRREILPSGIADRSKGELWRSEQRIN